ncbi:MAG: hypothetical protein ACI4RP_09325 [Acutalibacteraceae bacterium]
MSDIDTAERMPPHPAADAATFPPKGKPKLVSTLHSPLSTLRRSRTAAQLNP